MSSPPSKPVRRRAGLVSTLVWSGATSAQKRWDNLRLAPLHLLPGTPDPAPTDVYSAASLLRPSWAKDAEERIKSLEDQLNSVATAAENERIANEERRLAECSVGCKMWCEKVVKNKMFDRTILTLIIINCVFMAVSDPTIPETEGVNIVCAWTDYVFTVAFTIELVIKLRAIGWGNYFADSWNFLDFTCVLIGYLGMIPGSALGAFSGLRSLRALRPLRTLNSIPAMKNLVATVFTSAKLLSDVFILIFFLLFLFSIVALQFFAGAFRWRCFSELGTASMDGLCSASLAPDDTEHCEAGFTCVETYYNPDWGYTNFDNCISAMFNIFMIMSTEAWAAVMYKMMQSVSIFTFLYCSFIIFLLTIFSLNLTAAILASRFALARMDKQKPEEEAVPLTEGTEPEVSIFRRCLDKCRACCAGDPNEKLSWYQEHIGRHIKEHVTDKKAFEYGAGATMGIYCLFLAAKHYPMSDTMTDVFAWVDKIAAGVFVVELMLKLAAEPWGTYFSNAQNIFDGVVVLLTFADIFFLSALGNVAALRMVRLLRVLQATRSLARLKSFWRVVSAVQHTFKSMVYFCMLLLLVMIIYALLAKELFGGKVDFEEFSTGLGAPDEGDIDDRIDLDTFFGALTAVFAVLTGMWASTCWATMFCVGEASAVFWMSLIVIGNFVLLNLLLAVLIDKISANKEAGDEEEDDEEDISALIDEENRRKMEDARDVARRLKSLGMVGSALGQFEDEVDDLSDYEHWEAEDAEQGYVIWIQSFKATDLPSMDVGSQSDPFLKIFLPDEEDNPIRTEHVDDQTNPVWPESCRYQFQVENLKDREVRIEIWDYDLVSSDDKIGEMTINLASVFEGGSCNVPLVVSQDLTSTELPEKGVGSISFELLFLPANTELSEQQDQIDTKDKISRIGMEEKTRRLSRRISRRASDEPLDPEVVQDVSRLVARRLSQAYIAAHHMSAAAASEVMPSERSRSRRASERRLTRSSSPEYDQELDSRAECNPPANGSDSDHDNGSKQGREVNPQGAITPTLPPTPTPPAQQPTLKEDQASLHDHTETQLILHQEAFAQSEPSGCCPCFNSKVAPEGHKYEVGTAEHRAMVAQLQEQGKMLPGTSLLILGPTNPFRLFCHALAYHPVFEGIIIALILFSCVMLAMETPDLDKTSVEAQVLDVLNLIFTVIFIVEMTAKIVASGFICGETAYLKDAWNKLDFLIVLISVVSLAITNSSLKALKALRALRALRPLRLISRLKGLKVVFVTIVNVLPNLSNVCIFMFIVWLFFGILGVHAFGGMYWVCNQPELDEDQCVGTCTVEGEATPCTWTNSDFNFDNIGNAMVTLFVIGTLDDWTEQMWEGIDVTSPGLAPEKNSVPYLGLYFVCFIVMGSFLVLNLFVGEIVNAYSTSANATFVITPEQRQWVVAVRINMENSSYCEFQLPEGVDPSTTWGNIRAKCFDFCLSVGFEKFIMFVIVLNIMSMALQFYNQSDEYTNALELANLVFSGIFLVEFIIKLTGLGIKQYVSDAWNLLDGTVVVISVFGIVSGLGGKLSILRAMRMLRIAKLVRTMRGLRSLIATLFCSLPALGNVGMLMELNIFIFSVLGMNLFGEVSTTNARQLDNENVNFTNIWKGHLLLFRVLTFDDWKGILKDCMQTEADGNCTEAEQNCGSFLAIPYFLLYIVSTVYVLLNIFTAVILLNFQSAALEEGLSDMGFLSSALYKSRRFNALISDLQKASLDYLNGTQTGGDLVKAVKALSGSGGAEIQPDTASGVDTLKEDVGVGTDQVSNPLQGVVETEMKTDH